MDFVLVGVVGFEYNEKWAPPRTGIQMTARAYGCSLVAFLFSFLSFSTSPLLYWFASMSEGGDTDDLAPPPPSFSPSLYWRLENGLVVGIAR